MLIALVGFGLVPIARAADTPPPNILLIVVDDLGIDQWKVFGYGGNNPAPTPNIDTIANAGVKFHNMWSMPACSNGRAALFTGRYPFRTHVYTAIGSADLANYMVNHNEMTIPKLLKQKGYTSAMFGKFHMGTQGHNPYGLSMVTALGWNLYDGWLDQTGDPSSIDTTAGGVSDPGTWSCGFVRDATNPGGADTGACYAGDGTCQVVTKTGAEAPGRVCRDGGGIFDPNKSCVSPVPGYINFGTLSGHFVSPLVIDNGSSPPDAVASTDIRARTYRAIEQVDAAVSWINSQPKNQPWMASVDFAIAHTPLMQPPSQLLPANAPDTSNLDCGNLLDQNIINFQMTQALDTQVGNLLVGVGLATRGPNGQLIYRPGNNTYVVFVDDNGSTGTVVKSPFDTSRAKSTAYQTGVWVPGFVAGPGAKQGRQVNAMVNIVDLFQLFGELAGVDVHASVPAIVDSESLLPYLKHPGRAPIRKTNYTELGTNQHANGAINGPCQYGGGICTQIAPTKGVCEDNNGIWWGAGATDPVTAGIPAEGFTLCCEVAKWQADHPSQNPMVTQIYPLEARGIRNKNYKLVVNTYELYDSASDACVANTTNEFYQINEKVPTPLLDEAGDDLLTNRPSLSGPQQRNYNNLTAELSSLLASQPICPGDINLDGVVNYLDIAEWANLEALTGLSSWADINQDAITDDADLAIILQNEGICPSS